MRWRRVSVLGSVSRRVYMLICRLLPVVVAMMISTTAAAAVVPPAVSGTVTSNITHGENGRQNDQNGEQIVILIKETDRGQEKRSNGEKICARKLRLSVLQIFRRLRFRYLGVERRRRSNKDKVAMINGV
ncbi:hypothetical protein L1887_01040 [Cichorium endivia]|nr:hypothetical protein L1887_01040 [Cichorium endivia]